MRDGVYPSSDSVDRSLRNNRIFLLLRTRVKMFTHQQAVTSDLK